MARRALVEEGVAGVKVDRLAQRLGVTRGGFYKHFVDREDLLQRLLAQWEQENALVPDFGPLRTHADAMNALREMTHRMIEEDGFDPRFDMAVRDWARNDRRAAWAVERVDSRRLEQLRRLFVALGCKDEEAAVRARVLYYHQIGYYALGVNETTAERKRLLPIYLRILIGVENLEPPTLTPARRNSAEASRALPRA